MSIWAISDREGIGAAFSGLSDPVENCGIFPLVFASIDQLALSLHFYIRKIVIFYNLMITIRK